MDHISVGSRLSPSIGSPIRKTLALVTVFIPISMLFIFSFSILYYGTPEFRVDKTQHGLKIGEIRQLLNPVQPGDMIIGIGTLDYQQILSLLVSPKSFSKTPPVLIIQRDGEKQAFRPRLAPVSPFTFLSVSWPHLVLIFTLILLGTLSYLRTTSDQPAFLFLMTVSFFATAISATFPSYFGVLDPGVISLSFFTLAIGNWMAFGSYLHFVFSFPNERNLIRNKRWLVPLFYLAAPLISITGALVLSDTGNDFWGWLQRLRNMALPFMAAIAFTKHFIDYFAVSSSLEKHQIKLIISAYWLSFGPYILFYAIPNILFNNPFISFRLVVLSGIILPGAYGIALVRYRLLDADKMISRTVSYFLLIGLLSFSYSYLVIFLKRVFMGRALFSEEIFLIYVIAIAVLFEPANRLISFVLDKIFLPRALYRYDMMPALTRRIGSSANLKDLVHILTQTLPKDVRIRQVMLQIFEGNHTRLFFGQENPPTDPGGVARLKEKFSSFTDYLFCHAPVKDPQLATALARHQSCGIEIIFALRGGTGLSGLLLLGTREDGRPYTRRDIQFFTTISNQAGLALENALHYESLVESKKQIENMFGKVVQSEKMAALGEMSTVLAHELKNPLGIIRSSAQYLTKHSNNPETRQELLEYIIGEVDGLESTINNMMGLARYKAPKLAAIDLYSEMHSMIDHWSHSGNHNPAVSIQMVSPEKPLAMMADLKQLQQVIFNCITNAEDAMPRGGKLSISVAPRSHDFIEIQLCDTGPGIPRENLENAFKQFFTTKEKGMGIGLRVCKQIVMAHNGSISIQNMTQGGLKVTITLPRRPLASPAIPPAMNPQPKEPAFA